MLLATINSGTLIIALPDPRAEPAYESARARVGDPCAHDRLDGARAGRRGGCPTSSGERRPSSAASCCSRWPRWAPDSPATDRAILWRIIQGIGGLVLFANAAAIVTDAFPREQLGLAMGTNTMVAAVGLVIGPVLGGALVAISWHWVFWFNVPLALAGSAWAALILRELTSRDEDTSFDLLGTVTFLVGLTGLVLGISKGGISGWDSPVVIGGLIAAAVRRPRRRSQRSTRARGHPDARPGDLQEPLVLSGLGSCIHQRARAVRADVRVRLLLPGSPGHSPIVAGIKLAPLALGMLISSPLAGIWGGPTRVARDGGRRDARNGNGAGADAPASGGAPATGPPARTCSSWGSAAACSTLPTPPPCARDGRGPPTRDRRRGPRARPEHGGRYLDCVRAGRRHQLGSEDGAVQRLLRPGQSHLRRPAGPVHLEHAHRAVVPGRDLGARRVRRRRTAEARRSRGAAQPGTAEEIEAAEVEVAA